MKNVLFIAAVASMTLASCVNDEPQALQETTSDKEITFTSPVVNVNSRAAQTGEVGTTYNTNESFKVWAVWHSDEASKNFANTGWSGGTVYMNGVVVSKTSTDGEAGDPNSNGKLTWAPATKYYWPKNGSLAFGAVSPAECPGTASYGNTGVTITDLTIENDVNQHYVDILYSARVSGKKACDNTDETYDGVDINFKHALASIHTTIKTAADYTAGITIKVTNVKYTGILNKGSFDQKLTNNTTGAGSPTWSWGATTAEYVSYNGVQEVTVTPFNLNGMRGGDGSTALILLPQTLAADAKIVVSYTIKSKTNVEIPQTAELDLTPDGGTVTEWEMGKRYTYNIVIGLEEIYFAPSVTDWTPITVTPDVEI